MDLKKKLFIIAGVYVIEGFPMGIFRDLWPGPIMLKGVQDVDDARTAADLGIEAVALSNHGGRQLDSSPSVAM